MVLAVIALLYVGAALLYIAVNRKRTLAMPLAVSAGASAPSMRRRNSTTSIATKTANITDLKPKILFEPAPRLLYEALKKAAGDHAIFARIRVADLLKPHSADQNTALIDFKKIADQYFDFVICRGDSLTVLAAIRLQTANAADAAAIAERDKIVRSACKREKISLIVIKEKDAYDIEQLKNLLALLR